MASVKVLPRDGLGAAFSIAALAKISDPYGFIEAVFAYGVLESRSAVVAALLVPWIELTIGLTLLTGLASREGALAAALLLSAFAIAQVVVLIRGHVVLCGCFGGDEVVGAWSLTRTVALGFASLAVARSTRAADD